MMPVQMSSLPLQTVAGGMTGGIVGLAYFALLFTNIRWYARNAIIAALIHLVRFGTLALVLFGLARFGYVALLSGLAGIMLARHVLIRPTRGPSGGSS